MILTVANQKGGAGKSTLVIALANYLSKIGKELIVVDFDFQQTVYTLWKMDCDTYKTQLYNVVKIKLKEAKEVEKILNIAVKNKDKIFVFDLPGKIDEKNIFPILKNSDKVIVPFSYDKSTFESTYTFTQVLNHKSIGVKAEDILFVPNRIKTSAKFADKEKIYKALNEYGTITNEIPDRVAFQRIETHKLSADVNNACEEVFIDILNLAYGK